MGFPSLTKTFHRNTYPAINPAQPQLSASGKTVLITGGGRGLGFEIARAFAQASASHIFLLGRSESSLKEAKTNLEKEFNNNSSKTKFSIYPVDIVDKDSLQKTFTAIGQELNGKGIDILISNASYLPHTRSIADSDWEDWNTGVQVNIMGSYNLLRSFIPLASPSKDVVVVNISTGIIHVPHAKNYSGYQGSKLAQYNLFLHLQEEFPEWQVVSIHPGQLMTEMGKKAVADGFPMEEDHLDLASHFTVWAASPEAAILKGRFAWSNWDVDELKAKAKTFTDDSLTMSLSGWPGSD